MSTRGPALAGALVLLAVVGWVVRQAGQQPSLGLGPTLHEGKTSQAHASIAPVPTSSARAASTSLARQDARAAIDPTAHWPFKSAPLQANEVEYCGFGTAAAESPAAQALAQQAGQGIGAAADRLFALMATSTDARTRAAAQLAHDERDALATTARQSGDPTVYAMALQACQRGGSDARSAQCETLSAGQQARLDPNNAVPWLQVAGEALQRKDMAGVAEAVYRAALASTSRSREFAFTDVALSALPTDWPARDAMLASARVLEIHASLALPRYIAAVQHCATDRVAADANLQQTCDRLARGLTERGDTLIDYGIGRRIGERAGWPAEVVELNNARFAAYMRSQTDGDTLASNMGNATGCDAMRRFVRLAFAHSRDGELASVKAEVARLGVSDAVLIERYRAELRQRTPAASAPK